MASIATTLGVGSGIDSAALIEQLSEASKAPKEAAIVKREEANTAKISAMGEAASSIDAFAKALSSLVSGGTLFTQPTSSDSNVLTASAAPGARIGALSAQIEVKQLAQAQSIVSEHLSGISAAVGQGTITLKTADATVPIIIGPNNDNLTSLARAINTANVGVTASIVEDTNGARLVLKSLTGAAKAFTLEVDPASDPALSRFAYDPNVAGGMDLAQKAEDAKLLLDGVEILRSSNSISDLIAGVKIELRNAKPGTLITLGSQRPTESIRQAVSDFVDAYNELKSILDKSTAFGPTADTKGALYGDTGIREMQRQLSRLSTTVLSRSGRPSTLAEIGVRTERDGTLTVNSSRLDEILASDPDGVEALFNPGQQSDNPLVVVTSQMGRAKPGTYQLTELVASANGNPATGKIAGYSAISADSRLVASISSPASGLVVELLGNVANATVTVDLGLGGALQAIRDQLLAASGPIKSTQARLGKETQAIADDRLKMETREANYHDQLVRQFTAMDKAVAAYKSTQSYLDQQIKMWTKSDD